VNTLGTNRARRRKLMSDDTNQPQAEAPQRFAPYLEPTFHGSKPPRWELEREFPWHRAAALCFARGATSREVARSLGKSEPAVQNLIKQPWFQKEVTTLMEGYGHRDLAALFQAEQFNSLTTLTELRDNPKVPASARIACARDILRSSLRQADPADRNYWDAHLN
jgi:hypothetical protein